ncbi:MAG: hypothetical protein KIT14_03915 [bacterium]|nr:hypothetical protein [bacterium]
MNTLVKGILTGTAALMLAAWTPIAQAATCGDLNNNGGIDAGDCTLLLDVAVGPPDPVGLCGGLGVLQCGDLAGGDGVINTADVSACLLTVSGGETVFPLCGGAPQQMTCPGGLRDITSNINTSQVWLSGCTYRIDRVIFVQPGVTLSIQSGVKVIAKKAPTAPASVSALVFLRDSKINATGTQAAPITFTSDQNEAIVGTVGNPKGVGDWGGIVLNGRARVNVPGGEGLSEGLDAVPFGGLEDNDSSGVVQFVRVEFAGKVVGIDNELNLFTMNALGQGTVIDHVHAHAGLDDAHEWFGGNVKSRYLLASAQGDDGLDWQLGFTGAVQFAAVWQDANRVESGGSNGIEADNNENNFNATPVSNPAFCNVTLCGTADQTLPPGGPVNQFGMLLRRGTSGRIANTIVEGFRAAGGRIQHNETSLRFATGNTGSCSLISNTGLWSTMFFNNVVTLDSANITGSTCTAADLLGLWTSGRNVTTGIDPQVDCATPTGMITVPPAASPASAGGINCATQFGDAFFQNTAYRGAFQPGGTSWALAPWAVFPVN